MAVTFDDDIDLNSNDLTNAGDIDGVVMESELIETSAGAGDAGKVVKLDSTGKFDSTVIPASGGGGGGISNVVEDTTPQLGGQLDVNGQAIGNGTLELVSFVEDGSAVNHIEIENEATGSGPILRSTGDDAAVDLNIQTKSTGSINLVANTSVTGNIIVSGTVDGRDVASDGSKLDGIESLADVTDAANVDSAGAVMESDYDANTVLAATSDNTPTALTVGEQTLVGRITSGNIAALSTSQVRTLINVEDGSTADQTGAEIKAAYEAEANTNAFDDAAVSKLAGIESLADVTDAANVDAAGAVMESDYDANTILAATSDNTPAALTVGEQTLVGRITSGNIAALTASQIRTLLNVEDGATADMSASEILAALLTVDGASSGLDADTIDGEDSGDLLSSNPATTLRNTIVAPNNGVQPLLLGGHASSIVDLFSVYQGVSKKVAVDATGVLQAGAVSLSGTLVTTSTVDGRDIAADGTKLDGIESGATADQTGAEIKSAYEAEADTNAFTDASVTALAGTVAAQYLTLATSTTLSDERVLTPGIGMFGTDAGAGSTYTLALRVAQDVFIAPNTRVLNIPAAVTEIGSVSRCKVDLTNADTFRLSVHVSTAAAAGGITYLQYSTDGSAWTQMGSNTVSVTTTGTKVTAYESVPVGAKSDVFIRAVTSGGNAVNDPYVGPIHLQLK